MHAYPVLDIFRYWNNFPVCTLSLLRGFNGTTETANCNKTVERRYIRAGAPWSKLDFNDLINIYIQFDLLRLFVRITTNKLFNKIMIYREVLYKTKINGATEMNPMVWSR
jgi:hypothetical protein